MSGTIVNLRQARKARDRLEAERAAAENRARHGQPKAARRLADKEAARAAAVLEGARLTDKDRDEG